MNKEILYEEYKNKLPKYERAERNVKGAMYEFLKENNIDFLAVSSRIKDFDSFYEKVDRKNYDNPFLENEDFCGMRIILYYLDDIEKVQEIIQKNFKTHTSENKSEKLELNEFGYRSNHLIIQIKKPWCVTPNYKGLEDIKIEIQIRTSLMHTWAQIEHKLGYKSNQELDEKLKRKLYLISAKLEDADIQFQEIKEQSTLYKEETIKESHETGKFVGKELNIDTIQALLVYYFPDYIAHQTSEELLLNNIIENKISIEKVSNNAEQILPYVNNIEEQLDSSVKSFRSNLLRYGLEVFNNDFKTNAGNDRKKIIDRIKKFAHV